MRRSFILIVTMAVAACKTIGTPEAGAKAVVTPEQFAATYELIDSTKDYIPYDNPLICFARALFMSLALASEQIPSSAHFAFAPSMQEKLKGPKGEPWDYHVAVMIRANDSGEQMVFDPALSWDGPIVDWKWLQKMTMNPQAKTLDVPGSIYAKRVGNGEFKDRWVVESFAAMPPFRQADIEQACGEILKFQTLSNNLPIGFDEAKARLFADTIRFSHRMAKLGKLEWGSLTPGVIYCGKQKIE